MLGPMSRFIVLAGLLLCLPAACTQGDGYAPSTCPAPVDAGAAVGPSGVYRYASSVFVLRGTITFASEGSVVRVTDTSYDNAPRDRALGGRATLAGNRLDIKLTPTNGDTNYTADLAFVFTDEGRRFCVLGFSDTNGDVGGDASFFGQRVAGGSD
jgi:hypothetical protein